MRFYLMESGITGVKMGNPTIGKHVENLHVSAQNTQTIKNTTNLNKIAKNTPLTLTPSNNNATKHTTITQSLAKLKTSYSIATSNNIQNTSYNTNDLNNETFKQKPSKNQIIANTTPIATINNLNYENSKTTNNNSIILIIAIEISKKLIITPFSIAKIKTILNPLIAKTAIVSSIKIASKLNQPIKIHIYLDNSLVDKYQ